MTYSNTPTQTQGYLEQTVSLLGSVATWMRLPAIASTVRPIVPVVTDCYPYPSSTLL